MVSSRHELILVDDELSPVAEVSSAPASLTVEAVHSSIWRGILLVEPDITLLTAEVLLLSRLNYCVTPAFSQGEIFALRETKAIALAILSDRLGPSILAAVAQTVRKQWPLARILILGRPESMLEDHLYDEEADHSCNPMRLPEDLEKLYKDSWNQRSHTLDWDVRRSDYSAPRSLIRESDPTKVPNPNTIDRILSRSTPADMRYGQDNHLGGRTSQQPFFVPTGQKPTLSTSRHSSGVSECSE